MAERWRRHLLREHDRLGFEFPPASDDAALRFDLLSETHVVVVTGHSAGTVTINLAEGLDSERERIRIHLGESYRTMLGHLRHEVGHYIEWLLLERPVRWTRRASSSATNARTTSGRSSATTRRARPPTGSSTTSPRTRPMHPYEDFAETWAHHLHIQDTVETAVSFGLIPAPDAELDLRALIVGTWIPSATAGNMLNRSMGQDDLSPFAIPDDMMPKLEFVARVRSCALAPAHAATPPATPPATARQTPGTASARRVGHGIRPHGGSVLR